MNDEFLHRLRKAPPPEFLNGLKARLDRQPKLPHPRRPGFGRGLIVGFLVAGVAFAVTSVSLTGLPTSTAQFFSAPVQFFSRIITGQGSGDREADHTQIKAVPLSPWFQTPITMQPASAPESGRTSPVSPGTDSASATGAGASATSSGAVVQPTFLTASIAVQDELFPMIQSTLPERVGGIRINLITKPAKEVFASLCKSSYPYKDPYLVITTQHAAADPACQREQRTSIVELNFGYQAVMLVRSKLYGPLNLSSRDLFLALAQKVPNPEHPDVLIDNPYTTWNQLDPALPYDAIQIYGPMRDSPEGRLAAKLLLDAGCNTFATLSALRGRDEAAFETACRTLRTDRAYQEFAPGKPGLTDMLAVAPTALGITEFGTRIPSGGLIMNPLDGIAPDYPAVAAHTYPASRALYVYLTAYNINSLGDYWANNILWSIMNPWALPTKEAGNLWGFVHLNDTERAATLANLKNQKTVPFGQRR